MEGSNLSAHRGLKNDFVEIKKCWCGVVLYFVSMCFIFVNDLLLYAELGFVLNLVKN